MMTSKRNGVDDGKEECIRSDDANEAIVKQITQQTVDRLCASIDQCAVNSFDLKQVLKRHFDAALSEFSEIFGPLGTKECAKYKGLLIVTLKTVFRTLCKDFQNRIGDNLQVSVMTLRTQIETEITSKTLTSEELQKIIDNTKASILQRFDGDLFRDHLEYLRNLLDEEALRLLSENNRRLGQIHEKFNVILPDLLATYMDLVEMMLPDEDLETASEHKLESTFRKCQSKVVMQLNQLMTFDNENIKDMFEAKLTSILQEQFSEKINEAKIQQTRKSLEAEAVISTAVKSFAESMSLLIEENSNDSVIQKCQDERAKASISSITMQIYEIMPDRTVAKQILEAAKNKMDDVVQEMKKKRQIQINLFSQKWDAELNCIREKFISRMSEPLKLKSLPDLKAMQSKRLAIMKELISSSNASWITKHKDKSTLLVRFQKDAEGIMLNCSTTILDAHGKLLNDIYEQHKHLMNECLENHKMKMNQLLNEDLDDEIMTRAKSVGGNTIRQFEKEIKNISPTCATFTSQFANELNQAISKAEDQFQNKVRDRKLLVKAEVSQIVEGTINDYTFLMNALSIASNYGKDKISQIHDNLKARAQCSFQKKLKFAKYSVDLKELQNEFETKMQEIYNNTLATMDIQHREWDTKLTSCHQTMCNHYKQQFTSLMGNIPKEDDLEKLHTDLKHQTIELWEESFPMDTAADKLLHERRKFASKLDDEFKTSIREKWQQINLDIDRNAKKAIESILKEYEREMKSTLNSFDYVSDDMMLTTHEKLFEKANQSLRKVAKPEKVDKNTYTDLLQSRLVSTLECYRTENTQKQTDLESSLSNKIRHLKDNFSRDLFDLNVLPETSASTRAWENQLRPILDQYKAPDDCREKLRLFASAKMQEAMKEIEEEWDKKQPNTNELQLCINKAVEEYNKEMDNRTSKTGQVFVSSAMNNYHQHALAVVLQNFQRNVRQTSAVREKFSNAIDEVFKKFQELNNIRAADCFDAAIGIDLGTTFSCVAIYKGGKIEMIPDREHHSNTVPSYVFYENATKTVVGHAAKDQSVIHPRNTIFDSKRLIGRKLMDDETQKDITQWPFKVVQDPDLKRKEFPKIEVHGQTFYPEEVSGEVLKHLKRNAELHLDREVKDVVITVPAYFNDAQKRATKAAAAFANINVLEIINEPTSAAIAYSLNYTDGKHRNILVFDLGGGTFDVSILTTEKCDLIVKAVGGNNHLGGEDFDSNMVDFCIEKFRQETGHVIPKNVPQSLTKATGDKDETTNEDVIRKTFERLRRLRQKCEMAKITLSKTDKVRVVIDYIYEQKNLDVEVTVQDFNQMNQSLFNKCIEVVENTLAESKLTKDQIDDIILVGGSSRIPEVQRMLTEFFDGKSLIMTLNPDEVVAQGAAYRAAMLSGSKSSELKGIKFRDVNPLSIGIEVIGKKFSVILPKNTPLPATRSETYCTAKDYQTSVTISIYEGEDLQVKNNNLLGEFQLEGIPSKKRGEEPLDVTLECDEEGLLHVTAKVSSNSSSESITIKSNRGNLTEEDIQNAKSRSAS